MSRAPRREKPRVLGATAGAGAAMALAFIGLAAFVLAPPGPVTAQRGARRGASRHAALTRGIECSACHTPEGWGMAGGSGSGGFDHARTGFPLSGRHRSVACTGCHAEGRETSRECAACHADEHQGRLGGSCDGCHTARGWDQTRDLELHRRTRLPLTGMHALADCTDCHRRTGERQWSGAPAECFACHEADYRRLEVHPPHQGDVDTPAYPRDCSICHRTSGWSPAFIDPTALPRASGLRAPQGHDLRFAIGFGPHRGLPCESCHVTDALPAAVRCTGCHAHSPGRLRAGHRPAVVVGDGGGCLGCHPGGSGR